MTLTVDPTTGMLPPSATPHTAKINEVHDTFVTQAPNQPERDRLFNALLSWVELAVDTFGPGRVWLDGGFITHKQSVPADVDLVLFPFDTDRAFNALTNHKRAHALLTLQDLFFMAPYEGGWSSRLQPVGGQVDAFLADGRDPDHVEAWRMLWSSVKTPTGLILPGVHKGFVEVVI